MFWGAVISALGDIGQGILQGKVNGARQSVLGHGQVQQGMDQEEARRLLASNLAKYQPAATTGDIKASQGDFLSALQNAMHHTSSSMPTFLPQQTALANERAAQSHVDNAGLAKMFGTISGIKNARQSQAIGTRHTGDLLAQIANRSRAQAQTNKNLAKSIHGNPWLSGLFSAAQSV